MADFHPVEYAKEHPYIVGVGVFGGGLLILWWLGYFSSSKADAGVANMAAAYYSAEAQQAVVGGQLQMATVQAAAQTAGQQIQANAALGIAQANDSRDIAVAASMYNANVQEADLAAGSANYIAGTQAAYAYNTAVQQANIAASSANYIAGTQAAYAYNTAVANNMYAYMTNQTNQQASLATTAMQTIIPQEIAATGGYAAGNVPGLGAFAVNTQGVYNVNQLISQGYTPQQAMQIAGVG